MAFDLIPEIFSMFLLGVWLMGLARFGRMFFKKRGRTKPYSDGVKKLRLRNDFKLKLKSLQKKVERLILGLKEMLSARDTTDNIN
jgi:hypothetical protein